MKGKECIHVTTNLFDTDENLHIIFIDRPLHLYLKSNYIDIRDRPFHFKGLVGYDFPPTVSKYFSSHQKKSEYSSISFLDMEDR